MTPSLSLPKQLLTGIAGIDDQHRALLHWARSVRALGTAVVNKGLVVRAAQFLIAYAKYHFDSEEYAMVASGFEDVARHRREHAMMRSELSKIGTAINENRDSAVGSLASLQKLIQGWLQNHISATDFAFARYCEQEPSARDVHLPSPKELQSTGFRVTDYEKVEAVHHAGEITVAEIKARLNNR